MLVDVYVDERMRRLELVRSSADVVRVVLLHWTRHVGGAPPPRWTTDDVLSWVNEDGLRANSRKSRLTKLRPFVRWLIVRQELAADPTVDVARILIPDGSPRDLTFSEARALVAVCPDDRARLIVVLMAQLGLRAGDVARIRIEDIDVRSRRLHVRAKGGRGEPTHWVPIPAEAWSALSAWVRAGERASGPLIRSYQRPDRGLQPATVSDLVGVWIQAAGLKEFPWDGRSSHALRHTCVQHMLDAGAGLVDVQHVLGHATIRSTEIYVRREPPGLRAAMEARRYLAA